MDAVYNSLRRSPTNHKSPALREPANGSTYSLAFSSLVGTLSTNYSITTFSTSETVLGPSSLSRRAVLALGKATLCGGEKLIIRRRLEALDTGFPHYNRDDFWESEEIYKDALEFSRRGTYPDAVRSRALGIILAQIGSRQTDLLVKALTIWAPVEVGFLVSDLVGVLDPLRLSSAHTAGEQSELVRVYQTSIVETSSHSLGPLIHFLTQLARYSLLHSGTRISRFIIEGSTMDFLLRLYHLNFVDPLRKPNAEHDERRPIHELCKTLLGVCSRVDQRQYDSHSLDKFHALWSMERHLSTELEGTLIERIEISKHAKPERIVSFIRTISCIVDDWPQKDLSERLNIHDRVVFSLIEFSGFPFKEREINYLALRALQNLVIFRGPETKRAFHRYVTSRCSEDLSGLISCIFKRISQLISMNLLDWDTFISRWYEPNLGPVDESDTRANGMLEIIDCFIEAAEYSTVFLDAVIDANILGLLRPFLEVEVRRTSLCIAKRKGDGLLTLDNSDMDVLGLIAEYGFMGLFSFHLSLSRTQTVLARAFATILPRLKLMSSSISKSTIDNLKA